MAGGVTWEPVNWREHELAATLDTVHVIVSRALHMWRSLWSCCHCFGLLNVLNGSAQAHPLAQAPSPEQKVQPALLRVQLAPVRLSGPPAPPQA